MNSTIKIPRTVRELGDMAASRGMNASELLAELESAEAFAHLTAPQRTA